MKFQLVGPSDVGFMFPMDCDPFPLGLPCGEIGAYRPVRLDRDTQQPVPFPLGDVRRWEGRYGSSTLSWQKRVRRLQEDGLNNGLRLDQSVRF